MKKRIISVSIIAGCTILMCISNRTNDNTVLKTATLTSSTSASWGEAPEMETVLELSALDIDSTKKTILEDSVAEDFAITLKDDNTTEDTDYSEEDEYSNLAIASDINNYVNIRSLPSTDGEIVGKIYQGAVAEIINEEECSDGLWLQIVSGSVEGYIKAEYFVYGSDAASVIDDYVTKYVCINADRLNVRAEADATSSRIGYLDYQEKAKLLEDCGEWVKVLYSDDQAGYISSQYVTICEEFTYAKSIEEEKAEEEAKAALAQREAELAAETAAANENISTIASDPATDTATNELAAASEQPAPAVEVVTTASYDNAIADTSYSNNDELRTSIIDYAMQYLGNVYIHGGQSLEKGTDCSGFTSLIYAVYGYSISRTPSGQLSSAGRSISIEEAKPGDIVCYSSNGGKSCTHVALYIGNGQIIHSANSRKGVIISDVYYSPIVGVKNVID